MNTNQLLAQLDAARVNGERAADARRVIGQEADTLRAAIQSGSPERIGKAKAEAERVLAMWVGY